MISSDKLINFSCVNFLYTFPYLLNKLFRDFDTGRGLTQTQFSTLLLLLKEDNFSMHSLCSHLNIERGSFTPVVDELLSRELITKSKDPSDKRKVNIELTSLGEETALKMLKEIDDHYNGKLEVLGKQEKSDFLKAVDDIYRISCKFDL